MVAAVDRTDVLMKMRRECYSLKQAGEFRAAMRVAKKALDLALATHGIEHVETAGVLHDIGGLYRVVGETAEAEYFYEKALRIRQAQLGQWHGESCLECCE